MFQGTYATIEAVQMPKDPEQAHSTIVEKGGTGGRHNVNWKGEKYKGNG